MDLPIFILVLLVFAVWSIGPGLLLVRRLRLRPAERLVAGVAASVVIAYLTAFGIYWLNLRPDAYLGMTGLALLATLLAYREIGRLWRRRSTRRAMLGYGFVAAVGLLMLVQIRHYAGGTWGGDWLEHYQRVLFFIEHHPLDTTFLDGQWAIPARPPLLNLVASYGVVAGGKSFAGFQVTFLLLSALACFPIWLLARTLVPRARSAAAAGATLLVCNPMFMQNITYTWTKMGTAFLVLTAIAFYVRSLRKRRDSAEKTTRLVIAFLALCAGFLAHYSAGPYAVFLGLHWGILEVVAMFRGDARGAMRRIAWVAVPCVMLLATWFGWSIANYGWRGTTSLNSTMMYGEQGAVGGDLHQMLYNFVNTLAPEILRKPSIMQLPEFQQTSRLGQVRDYAFLVYQVCLPFAAGVVGGPMAVWLAIRGLWRAGRQMRWFWIGFVLVVIPLGIAVNSGPDRFGVAQITLQPACMIAVALLAGWAMRLATPWRLLLAIGCAIDFVLGVAIHMALQNRLLPWRMVNEGFLMLPTESSLSHAAQYNTFLKVRWDHYYERGLPFFGDAFSNMAGAGQVLAVIAAAAALLWLATGRWPAKRRRRGAGGAAAYKK